MRMTARVLGAVGVVAVVAGVAGCSQGSDYCQAVRSQLGNLSVADVDVTDAFSVGAMADKYATVAKSAPADVKDDWTAVADMMSAVAKGDASAVSDVSDVMGSIGRIQASVTKECGL